MRNKVVLWTAGVVVLGMAILVAVWAVRFYQFNTFGNEGWRLLGVNDRTLTVEVTTSACAWVHAPAVEESQEAVEVRISWTQQPLPCSGQAVVRQVDVSLEDPLGDRTLLGCEGPAYEQQPPCEES